MFTLAVFKIDEALQALSLVGHHLLDVVSLIILTGRVRTEQNRCASDLIEDSNRGVGTDKFWFSHRSRERKWFGVAVYIYYRSQKWMFVGTISPHEMLCERMILTRLL